MMIWQRTHRHQLEQLIRSAKTDFPVDEGRLERVVRAIATAPAPPPARSRRRVIAVAAGALAALVALGFVPFPTGSMSGVLDRAIAAFETTSGFYMRTREVRHLDVKDRMTEVWEAPGGLLRIAYWEEGKLQNWQVMGADFEAYYNPDHRWVEVYDLPPADPHQAPYRTLKRIREEVASRPEEWHPTVTEWRERSLWGEDFDIIEATERPEDLDQGTRKARYEVDAATGRLLSEKHWWLDGGTWKLVAWTEEVGWDVDIPSDTWAFVPPEGWRVRYHRWWTGRVENTVASGETRDWQVSVHAVDASKNGDLVITLSRLTSPETMDWLNRETPLDVTATDNLGAAYKPTDPWRSCRRGRYAREYWVTTLGRTPSSIPTGLPRTVTLTVHPSTYEPYADQVLTFPDLPLPPLQDKVEEQIEVVQY